MVYSDCLSYLKLFYIWTADMVLLLTKQQYTKLHVWLTLSWYNVELRWCD